jgi:glycosyltransferase involved in cell wall biosynthesis
VPTRFVANVCRKEGLSVQLEVIPEGIDPAVYRYVERPQREGLTALAVGPLVARKHPDITIAAWKLAFGTDPKARLILKSKFGLGGEAETDSRITIFSSTERTRGILHWYEQADVLLALGNEGFGLPVVEGMATGLPVVALNSEGQADVCADAPDCILPVTPSSWEACDDTPWGRVGKRGVPAVKDVSARLRWVDAHRDEARELGRSASAWALANRNIWTKGPRMIDIL